jgi:hypothetical protein
MTMQNPTMQENTTAEDHRALRERVAPLDAALAAIRADLDGLEARVQARLAELVATEARALYGEYRSVWARLVTVSNRKAALTGVPGAGAPLGFGAWVTRAVRCFDLAGASGAGPAWARLGEGAEADEGRRGRETQ